MGKVRVHGSLFPVYLKSVLPGDNEPVGNTMYVSVVLTGPALNFDLYIYIQYITFVSASHKLIHAVCAIRCFIDAGVLRLFVLAIYFAS
jgi:hypothetical protein